MKIDKMRKVDWGKTKALFNKSSFSLLFSLDKSSVILRSKAKLSENLFVNLSTICILSLTLRL